MIINQKLLFYSMKTILLAYDVILVGPYTMHVVKISQLSP